MPSSRKENLPAFGLYLLMATVMTWPLLGRLGTHVPLGTNDLWQNYWNLWWWKQALLRAHSPYTTDMIFHPEGAALGLHTHSPANMLLTMPINLLFGIAPAYNLAVFAGFALAGWGGFLLAREYTRGTPAALLAGIVAAYFPQHIEQSLEHLNLASYWAMPFFLWSLVRTVRRGGKWWLALGFFFALNALLAWHNGLMSIALGVAVAGFEIWRGPRALSRVALDFGRSALLATALLAPFAWPVVRDSLAGVAQIQKNFPNRSVDPLSLLAPHAGQPLWGSALSDARLGIRRDGAIGDLGYLGWVSLALVLSAFVTCRKSSSGSKPEVDCERPTGSLVLWVSLLLFFLVLSFGETLGRLPLPFHWLKSFPLFGLVRLPNRFLVPAALSLSVAAAIGADCWLQRLRPSRAKFAAGIFGLLMLLDYAWLPYPMRELPNPEWLAALAELPPDLAVLDLPGSHRGAGGIDMYLQTLHQRPIVGGYVSANLETTRRRFEAHPQLRRVFKPFEEVENVQPTLAESIRRLRTGIVVVHLDRTRRYEMEAKRSQSREAPNFIYQSRLYHPMREMPAPRLDLIRRELRDAFGPPVNKTPEVEIYRVR